MLRNVTVEKHWHPKYHRLWLILCHRQASHRLLRLLCHILFKSLVCHGVLQLAAVTVCTRYSYGSCVKGVSKTWKGIGDQLLVMENLLDRQSRTRLVLLFDYWSWASLSMHLTAFLVTCPVKSETPRERTDRLWEN